MPTIRLSLGYKIRLSLGYKDNDDYPMLLAQALSYFSIHNGSVEVIDGTYGLNDQESFSLDNQKHLAFIRNVTALFKAKDKQLKELCKNILLASAATAVLSVLPFCGMLATIAGFACLYYAAQYLAVRAEYDKSLSLLESTCHWSLGQLNNNQADVLVQNEVLGDMRNTLYLLLTEEQLIVLIDNSIEEEFVAQQNERKKDFEMNVQNHPSSDCLPEGVKKNASNMYRMFFSNPNNKPESDSWSNYISNMIKV